MSGNLTPPARSDLLEPFVVDPAAEPETPTAFRHIFERGVEMPMHDDMHEDNNPALGDVFERGVEPRMHEGNNPALADIFERGGIAPPAPAVPVPALTFFGHLASYLFGPTQPTATQRDEEGPRDTSAHRG